MASVTLVAIYCSLLLAAPAWTGAVQHVTCCNPSSEPGTLSKLRKNANVIVTISYDFSEGERVAIQDAFQSWNGNRVQNCSNVTFIRFTVGDSEVRQADNYWVGFDGTRTTPAGQTYANSAGYARTFLSAAIRSNHPPEVLQEYIRGLMRHEIGHAFTLNNSGDICPLNSTVMYEPASASNAITTCDNSVVSMAYCPAPSPTPTPNGDMCNPDFPGVSDASRLLPTENISPDPDCCSDYEAAACILNGGTWHEPTCTCISPIVIDVSGNGFDLTNAQNGVSFDIVNTGDPMQIAWTSAGSDDAWLTLDRNGNGLIDRGRELFGSSTPQPRLQAGETKNGFRALAVFDRYNRGGNMDGRISRHDAVYSELKLWRDSNHNGISEPSELFNLEDLGLRAIDLEYTEHWRQDAHGNWFRFRSRVRDLQDSEIGRWAWDVFLVVQQP